MVEGNEAWKMMINDEDIRFNKRLEGLFPAPKAGLALKFHPFHRYRTEAQIKRRQKNRISKRSRKANRR
jgi:hypothetical protein